MRASALTGWAVSVLACACGPGGRDDPPSGPCRSTDPFNTTETWFDIKYQGRAVIPSGFTADELTVYFSVYPSPKVPNSDVYIGFRDDRDEPIDNGVPVAEVNTPVNDGAAVESNDGLELYFSREDMPGITIRTYRATRASAADPFSTPALVFSDIVLHPSISTDGTELFFVSWPTYTSSYSAINRAVRNAQGGFDAVETLAEGLDLSATVAVPVISGDGLSLYYAIHDEFNGTYTAKVIRRTTRTSPFGAPADLALRNAFGRESVLWESPDSCRLYLDRDGTVNVLTRTPS